MVPPQPSALTPQVKPWAAQLVGEQVFPPLPESLEKLWPSDPSKVEASTLPAWSLAELPHEAATRNMTLEIANNEMRRPT